MSGYYIIDAITKVVAGFLYDVNPYIPIILSLTILLIATFLAMYFYRTSKKSKNKRKIKNTSQLKEIKEAFRFVLSSERVKGLILFACVMTGLISVLSNYEISLLEELEVSASLLGIIFAMLEIVSALAIKSKKNFTINLEINH